MDCLNILKLILDEWKDVNKVATFNTIIMEWYTGAAFALTPFKPDFVDYVECGTPVKDVTKFKNVIRIGTTIPKF